MAKTYRPVQRDQQFLLPPSMSDWLPDGHLVWFVLDAVEQLDTSGLQARAARRRDGRARRGVAGRASYDPDMLLTLLLYAYCCGERSSRVIERLCATDVAFRLICAEDIPDHAVLARFRQAHAEAFAGLFTQVLRWCREAGMARLGTVAIDGTKIAADASRSANRNREWLTGQVQKQDQDQAQEQAQPAGGASERETAQQVLVEAAETDAAEDAAFGAARGDEFPPGWGGRAGRRGRLRAAAQRIADADAAQQEAAQQAEAKSAAEWAERDTTALARAEAALAEQVATQQAKAQAWEQAWEQAVETGSPLPRGRAPAPVEQCGRIRRAQQRVDKARQRLEHPESARRPGGSRPHPDRRGRRDRNPEPRANTTDPDSSMMPTKNGWLQGYNAQLSVSADQIIIVTCLSDNPADITCYDSMVEATTDAAARLEATDELGTLLFDTGYASDHTLAAPGPDRLIALGKTHSVLAAARDNPATGPPPEGATARQAMEHRLRTPDGARLYTRRGATVEPAIGNLKKLLDRFSRRGLAAATSELDLTATVFNLLKLHRAAPS